MASDKETLLSMGFEPPRVEWALKATANRGLQPAMDHILEHDGQPVPDLAAMTSSSSSTAAAAAGAGGAGDEDNDAMEVDAADAEAKSIKCSQCGKTFRNTALANFHAEKSGHDQFEESTEEIKPLTEEEKKEKLAELREKMSEKRALKKKQEAEENKSNEIIRRKAGQDLSAIKEEMKAKEVAKEAARRKKEKLDDAKAKAAVRAQLEADKRERAEKLAREKALREGRQLEAQEAQAQPAAAAAPAAGTASKDYKETRLQIRLASGGQPYITTLPSDSTLRDVAEYLAGQTLDVSVDTVSFAQHFPRKQFTPADFSRTLRDLGLTPSAVLIAS